LDEGTLLKSLQYDFPLVSRPYAALAQQLGQTEAAVLAHTRDLLERRIIRSIRAFFDAARLNHRSALVAAHVPEDHLSRLASRVSAHPGVSHNYAREHHYNLWFTIAVPDSMDLHETAARLLPGVEDVLVLPALRLFKIDARFTPGHESAEVSVDESVLPPQHDRFEPDPIDKLAVYALSQHLPVAERAFAESADRFGLTEEVLLERARFYLRCGIMRRFGATLNHRRVGFIANGMTVWVVPSHRVEAVGQFFAGVSAVSHCYERPVYPNWPYNLFTMIHGQTREDVAQTVQSMAAKAEIDKWAILYSTIEFKKAAVSYYDPAWSEFL
jgi:DNA-binding Lrp family transcriptional regulator